ncbi:hypothetical protein DTO212C5_845 [Paecilomyces variotii]|nr:hypothetical protein DTO212C5_845 [Paecilomyces variotii]
MSLPWLQDSSLDSSLPQHCEPTTPFLATVSSFFHVCIPTPLALVSSLLGTISIVSWLFAQLPQIYKNYVYKSTAGLSPFFLVEWCLGDTANLLGALFTRQAGWQVTIAGYYVFVDVVLVFQYYWYTHFGGWKKGKNGMYSADGGDESRQFFQGVSPFEDASSVDIYPAEMSPKTKAKDAAERKGSFIDTTESRSMSYSNEKLGSSSRSFSRAGNGLVIPTASPKTVLLASMLCAVLANASPTGSPPRLQPQEEPTETAIEIAGRILSWMSTLLYLGSRLPQLYKNYCRQSTAGLSPLLFMAAFCGNFFYSSSLVTNPNAWYNFPAYGGGGWVGPEGNDRVEWVGRAMPFFLGAAGVLAMDGFMGVQFAMYGEAGEAPVIRVADPQRGRNRWRRVSGWMRGWIPSISPEGPDGRLAQEEQSLLGNGHERYGSV